MMANYKLMGTPIWVYTKDVDTKATIEPPKVIQGEMGSIFSIDPTEIDGYTLDHTEGEIHGVFSDDLHTVTFFYRKNAWAETQQLFDKYLLVLKDSNIYDEIDGEIVGMMPEKSTWKVTARVATKDGKFWYQLADSRWTMYARNNIRMVDSPTAATMPADNEALQKDWPVEKFHAMANVDYVANAAVSIYHRPYGHELAHVPNGQLVEVVEVMHDPSGVDWYHLAPSGWINGIYLKFQES